jgi:hypothetical protein
MKDNVCTLCNFVVVIGNLFTFLFFNYFFFQEKDVQVERVLSFDLNSILAYLFKEFVSFNGRLCE